MSLTDKADKLAKRAAKRHAIADTMMPTETKKVERKPRAAFSENVPTVRDRVKAKAAAFIAYLNEEMDKFLANGYASQFNFKTWSIKVGLATAYASVIAEYFRPQYNELLTVADLRKIRKIQDDKDLQLVEMYSHLSTAELGSWTNFLKQIAVKENAKAKKEHKIKKVLTKAGKTKKSTFEAATSTFVPAIIKAREVWTWNAAYNHMTRLVGAITLDGRKFLGVDESKSVCYTITKPEGYLSKVKNAKTAADFDAVFANIGKTPRYLRQKLQDGAVILRVVN